MRKLALALAGFVVGLPLLLVTIVIAWFAQAAGSDAQADIPATLAPGSEIPAAYWPIYAEAARRFDVSPWLLAAIHEHETGFSTNPDTYRINFAGCCIGPMQMNVRDGTWAVVKDAYTEGERPRTYPHPDTPHPSPTDSFDAIMAAAKLLRIKAGGRGIPNLDETAWRAARNYAGAGPVAEQYADAVLARARKFEASGSPHEHDDDSAELSWPVTRGTPITSPFCERRAWEACHPGVDLGVPLNTPVHAAADGIVAVAGPVSGYGNFVCLRHAARLATCYAHLSRIDATVHLGALVDRGQVIGLSGCTGRCYGPHLHFEVRLGGAPPAPVVDPIPYLR